VVVQLIPGYTNNLISHTPEQISYKSLIKAWYKNQLS